MNSEQENLFAQPAFSTISNTFSLTLACVNVRMCEGRAHQNPLKFEIRETLTLKKITLKQTS